MAVDVENFIIPEQSFRGLDKVSDTYERKNIRNEELERQKAAKKSASASFLTNYLNPKDNLTGTNYDPQIVKGFDDLLQEGMKLANQGADNNMIMMALSPQVAKLNQYSTTAKLMNQRIKDQLAQIPVNSGYDKSKLEELAKRTAFYDAEGNLKDINTIDPNVDYLTETIRLYPEQVTNDTALDNFIKTSPKFTNSQKVKRINSRGGYEMKNAKVTAPSWAVVDEEGEIVPRFDVASEGGEPHTFNFQTGEGAPKSAAIRLMNEKDFDSLMSSNPGIADWVRGQVIKAGGGANMNTPQAKNAARAIMYDELKRRGGGSIEDIQEVKANPAPRITIHNSNSSNKPPEQIDLTEYKDVEGGGKDITPLMQGFDVVSIITGKKFASDKVIYNPNTKKITFTNPTTNQEETMGLTTFLQNIKPNNANANVEWLRKGLSNPITGNKPSGGLKDNYSYNGKSYTRSQVEQAAKNLKMSVEDYIKKYNLK